MLHGDFYTIQSIQKAENATTATLALNDTHPVFYGHFPGRPVLPGACQLQMVKEIMQTVLNAELQLIKASQIKFLTPITPGSAGNLVMQLQHTRNEKNELSVTASLANDSNTCFKFNGVFRVELHDAW